MHFVSDIWNGCQTLPCGRRAFLSSKLSHCYFRIGRLQLVLQSQANEDLFQKGAPLVCQQILHPSSNRGVYPTTDM